MARALTPGTLDEIDRAPITISASHRCGLPASALWPGLAECDAWQEWFVNVEDCRWTSDVPHGVGSTRFIQINQFEVSERILAYEPDRMHAFCALEANIPIASKIVETQVLDGDADGTTITYTMYLWPTLLGKIVSPLLRRTIQADIATSLGQLERWARDRQA